MEDTSGFYKLDVDSDQLFYGPNFVSAPTFELLRELHETYTYPVDGWWWFDSEEEAIKFLKPTIDILAEPM